MKLAALKSSIAFRLATAAAALVLFWLLSRRVDLPRLGLALRGASIAPLAWAMALNVTANTFAKVRRWAALLRPLPGPPRRPGTWELARLLWAGGAVSNLLPARAGEALRAVELRRRGYPLSGMVTAQLLEKGVELLSIGVQAALALIFLGPPKALLPPLWIAAGAAAGLCAVLLVLGRVRAPPKTLPPEAGRVARAVHALRSHAGAQLSPRVWLPSLGWSIASDAVDVLTVGLSLSALGIALPPAAWAAVFVVVNLAIAVPSTPGYVGAIEAAAVFALTALGVEPERALAAALVYHAVHFLPTTALGALALRLRPVPAAEAA